MELVKLVGSALGACACGVSSINMGMNSSSSNPSQGSSGTGNGSGTGTGGGGFISDEQHNTARVACDDASRDIDKRKSRLKERMKEYDEYANAYIQLRLASGNSSEAKSNLVQAGILCDIMKDDISSLKEAINRKNDAVGILRRYHLQSHISLKNFNFKTASYDIDAITNAQQRVDKFDRARRNIPRGALE